MLNLITRITFPLSSAIIFYELTRNVLITVLLTAIIALLNLFFFTLTLYLHIPIAIASIIIAFLHYPLWLTIALVVLWSIELYAIVALVKKTKR